MFHNMEKKRQLNFFMTTKDEILFCDKIKEYNSNIVFVDTTPSIDLNIDNRIHHSVINSFNPFFSIVNLDLINKETLEANSVKYGEYYHFPQIGKAQIQFLRSKQDPNNPQNLRNGRIADSYDSDYEEKWKDTIYSILKTIGCKVYSCNITLEGNIKINNKAERNLLALPNAIERYTGSNGFMVYNKIKFIGKIK
jgi:hypothetical protein